MIPEDNRLRPLTSLLVSETTFYDLDDKISTNIQVNCKKMTIRRGKNK